MEESKELQGFYKIFRAVIYISVLMEFFEYAIDLAMPPQWSSMAGSMAYSKNSNNTEI